MRKTLDTVGSLGGLLYFVLAFAGYGMASTVLQPPRTRPLSRSSSSSNPTPSTASPGSVSLWNPSALCCSSSSPLDSLGDFAWATRTGPSGAVLALAVTTVATKFASFSPAFVAQLHPDRYGAAVVSGLVDANSLAYNGTLGLDAAFVGVTGLAIG